MAYLTTTASITSALQTYNCNFATQGYRYMTKLTKGQTSELDLKETNLGFSLIDAIVGYKAPSAEVLSTATITITGGTGGNISAYANGTLIGTAAWGGSVGATATSLASNITTTALYTASANSGVVTVSALQGTGANPNYVENFIDNYNVGIKLTATVTTDIAVTTTNFSGGISPKVDERVCTEFEDAADRADTMPTVTAEVGFQTDTSGIYQATGTSASTWSLIGVGQSFDDAEARLDAAPASVGQYGVQLDTSVVYIGTGTEAGDWVKYTQSGGITLAQVNNILNRLRIIYKN